MSSETIPLDSGYTAEIDCVDEKSWYEILGKFRDANIYQTWAYGAVRFGEDNISHIILRRDRQIVAAVQTRIVKIPVINAGITYVRWGPLWRRHDLEDSLEDFRQIVGVMHREYVGRRGLYLRIFPNEIEHCQNDLRLILEGAGFEWHRSDYRTLYLPLAEPLDSIRNNMSKNWRKHLNKAEKRGLVIVEGRDHGLFESVVRLYREMLLRKGFEPPINIDEYSILQESLPDYLKMQIMVCQSEGQPVAGLVGSAIGDVGIELIAATGNDSLELGASYLLRWKMVEYLKQCGCHFYNLNGINPERNPGGYQFKSGLSGKNGLDVKFLGIFKACKSPLSHLAVRLGETAREGYRKVNEILKKLQAVKSVGKKDEGLSS